MKLLDEEEIKAQKLKEQKTKKIIIISIVILLILCIAIIALIFYRTYNPDKITTYIDGQQVEGFDSILNFRTDENNQTQIYVQIKEMAQYINNYKSFDGEYLSGDTVDKTKCYVIRENYEVATYSLDSNTIYKLNLQTSDEDYEYFETDQSVFESDGKLYASIEGIEKGYNLSFTYNEKKKVINIFTMDYLVDYYATQLETKTIVNYESLEADVDNFKNCKAIFDNMLVIKADGKYAVIDINDYSFILEPKYDNIEYIESSTDFLIVVNQKEGIVSKEGKTKVNAIYDELILMDKDATLYRMKKNNLYGVIDENENVIIYAENDQIGVDISNFSDNGIKNGYLLLDALIPVKQDKKWAFYNTKGEMITDGFIYDEIGYVAKNSNNVYSLLAIPNYEVIIVGQDDKYTFMDINGNDEILPFVFEAIYMQISGGEVYYRMTTGEKTYDVLENLIYKGVTEKSEDDV